MPETPANATSRALDDRCSARLQFGLNQGPMWRCVRDLAHQGTHRAHWEGLLNTPHPTRDYRESRPCGATVEWENPAVSEQRRGGSTAPQPDGQRGASGAAWTSAEDRVEALWQKEHTDYPSTSKATFIRNCLFGGQAAPSDLGTWALAQDDLPDQVYESASNGYLHMIETPAPDEGDGRKWYRADPDGPRVIVRIQMETVRAGGESKLSPKRPAPGISGGWYDD